MLKQLLYLNDWELSAYRQEGGVLKRLAVFQEGYSGNQACASYLAASSAVPAYLLEPVIVTKENVKTAYVDDPVLGPITK